MYERQGTPVWSALKFISSEPGTTGFVWTTVLLLFGVPLLYLCQHHVLLGNLGIGCLSGGAGLAVSGVSARKLWTALRSGLVGF